MAAGAEAGRWEPARRADRTDRAMPDLLQQGGAGRRLCPSRLSPAEEAAPDLPPEALLGFTLVVAPSLFRVPPLSFVGSLTCSRASASSRNRSC